MQEDSEEDNGLEGSDFTVDSSRVPESTSEESIVELQRDGVSTFENTQQRISRTIWVF